MKRALMYASVASMIDLFNMDNILLLQELGYSVDVACNFNEGNITSDERIKKFKLELNELGVGVYELPIPRSLIKFKDIKDAYKKTLKLANNNEYDLVHCHSPIGGVICRWAFRKSEARILYTAHGFHFFKGASLFNWLIFYPVEKLLAYYTDVLITINNEDYIQAQNFGVRDKVVKTNGIGVNIDRFKKNNTISRRELLNKYNISDNDILLVSVGQLSKRKNHEIVIKSLSKLKNPNIKYIIIGDGELKVELEQLIDELSLNEQVCLLGYRENVNDFLSVSDILVFPSLQEGLPASLMEAMAIGLPCVVSNIRGNSDLIKHEFGGLLFDNNDVTTLSREIKVLSEDIYLREKYGSYNKEFIKNYSNIVVGEQMKDIYI